jgi:hypothetical protein
MQMEEAPRREQRPVQDNYRVPDQPTLSAMDVVLPLGWFVLSATLTFLTAGAERWSVPLTLVVLACGSVFPALGLIVFGRMRRNMQHSISVNQRLLREVMSFVQPLTAGSSKLGSVRGVVEQEITALSGHLDQALGRAADIEHQMRMAADTLTNSFANSEGRLLDAIQGLELNRSFFVDLISHIENAVEQARVSLSEESEHLAAQVDGAGALAQAAVQEVNHGLSQALSRAAEEMIRTVSIVLEGDVAPLRSSIDLQIGSLTDTLANLRLDVETVFIGQQDQLGRQLQDFERRLESTQLEHRKRAMEIASASTDRLFKTHQDQLDAQVAATLEKITSTLSVKVNEAQDRMLVASLAAGKRLEMQMSALEQRIEQSAAATNARAEVAAASVGESLDLVRRQLASVEEISEAARRDLERLHQGAAEREQKAHELFSTLESTLAARLQDGGLQFQGAVNQFMDLVSAAMMRHAGDIRSLIDTSITGAAGRLHTAAEEFRQQFKADSTQMETTMLHNGRQLTARLQSIFEEAEAHNRTAAVELSTSFVRRSEQLFDMLRDQGTGAESILRETSDEVRALIGERLTSFGDAVNQQVKAELNRSLNEVTVAVGSEIAAQIKQVDAHSTRGLSELTKGIESFSAEMDTWRAELHSHLAGELGVQIKQADVALAAAVGKMGELLSQTASQTKAEIDKSAMSVMVKFATEEKAVTRRFEQLAAATLVTKK